MQKLLTKITLVKKILKLLSDIFNYFRIFKNLLIEFNSFKWLIPKKDQPFNPLERLKNA